MPKKNTSKPTNEPKARNINSAVQLRNSQYPRVLTTRPATDRRIHNNEPIYFVDETPPSTPMFRTLTPQPIQSPKSSRSSRSSQSPYSQRTPVNITYPDEILYSPPMFRTLTPQPIQSPQSSRSSQSHYSQRTPINITNADEILYGPPMFRTITYQPIQSPQSSKSPHSQRTPINITNADEILYGPPMFKTITYQPIQSPQQSPQSHQSPQSSQPHWHSPQLPQYSTPLNNSLNSQYSRREQNDPDYGALADFFGNHLNIKDNKEGRSSGGGKYGKKLYKKPKEVKKYVKTSKK